MPYKTQHPDTKADITRNKPIKLNNIRKLISDGVQKRKQRPRMNAGKENIIRKGR